MSDGAHDHHTSHESADTNATSSHGTSPKKNLRHWAVEMHALLVAKLTRSHAAMLKRWPALPEATLDNAAELYERFRDADGCSRSLHDDIARAKRRRRRVVIAGCNWWTDRADEAARKLITIGASLGLDVTPLIQYVADVHHISTILYCTRKPQKSQDMCSAAIRTASLVSVTAASQTPDTAAVHSAETANNKPDLKQQQPRRGRLSKEESEAKRATMLATIRQHSSLKDDPAKLAHDVRVSESTIRRWLDDEEQKYRESRPARPAPAEE